MSVRHESGSRIGWLYNYHPTTETSENDSEGIEGSPVSRAALVLLFQDHAKDFFYVHLHYNPYLFVHPVEGHEREVELGLLSTFPPPLIRDITLVEKEDLDQVNHLSGLKRRYLKVIFNNVQDLTTVRGHLQAMVKRNASMTSENPLWSQFNGSLGDAMAKGFEEDLVYNQGGSARWMDWMEDIREYDVKYHMRVAIDLKVLCGLWYEVTITDGEAGVVRLDDNKFAPAMPRVVAFDIETTKAPLKFPQPEVDEIYMISYMLDGRGYLIINREIVTEDISPFEYTPRPEYEGFFDVFNEANEADSLRRFFAEMKKFQPNVYVTYNGDYFDFPFVHARALFHGMNMKREIGFAQAADGAFLNPQVPHLDCFYWVKRDSYLPQGSQGLKAVTKAKLGYDPIEVNPEDMLPLAQSHPQRMASYSVSDAVSTWYLYQKYIHPFIYSLATIIPMAPDDVLRKGTGGLCESLLMVQAEANNVIFPNKKEMVREKFYDGHLIDSETYIGGRVEALRSGVYRSDIPMSFSMNPDSYQSLMDDVDSAMRFSLEVENNVKMEEVTNFQEVTDTIRSILGKLRDHPKQQEKPVIYHLDVGAMYPNIILTNRLQPYAIVKPDVCAGCCFNSVNNEHRCKRPMQWKWRGELFTAGRYEYQRVKAQLENESFAAAVIEQANLAAVQKKAYGNRKGNVLEGTAYERKNSDWKSRQQGGGGGGGSGYRQEGKQRQREAAEALLRSDAAEAQESDGDDSDGDTGLKAFHKLNENTQFNMLKKRLSEYSRKAYGKIHESKEIMRSDVVCQRENSFYVDTVRLFRDRRYEYKAALKTWKKNLDKAKTVDEVKLCQSRCVQMESLQLAHKCILNSFYGYVMRKGSRWYSMEMAGLVTYLGATLIQMARALVQQIGVTLELDTDGIWCCLPCTFPENFTFTTSNPAKPKVTVSYPCVMLNKMVNDRYSNHQYQDVVSTGVYKTRSECSIYFEVDGPYLSMILPASRDEGKSIKKRYAVFNPDGRLAELKGFELKRRGELMLIKDFQSQVFRRFLDGATLKEAYASAAVVADAALDMLESKGDGFDVDELLEKITESSNMTRRLAEYPESQKSLAITTARRIAEFLGPQMVKDKGLACHFVISRLPAGRTVTERAIPLMIFRAEPAVRTYFLRKWTGDATLPMEIDLTALLDWDYYTVRFNSCVQKIITIPAALQSIPNPVPRVPHPDWLQKRIRLQNSNYRQISLTGMLHKKQQIRDEQQQQAAETAGAAVTDMTAGGVELQDMEDVMGVDPTSKAKSRGSDGLKRRTRSGNEKEDDSDWEEVPDDGSVHSEDELERMARERDAEEETLAQELKQRYFTPKSTQVLDAAFFSAEGSKRWLQNQREGWLHRARLRKELAASDTNHSGATDVSKSLGGKHFIDLKSRALTATWNIVEVRENLDDSGTVTVIAALERSLSTFRVRVPRQIVVDVDEAAATFIGSLPGSVELVQRVLPRHKTPGRVFQVELPPGAAGEHRLNELSIHEGVRELYETHRKRHEVFVEVVGCCANVNAQLHLKNYRAQSNPQRDLFTLEELETAATSNYLTHAAERSVFIFHASSSDTRGVIAVFNQQTATGMVVFVQPPAAARPSVHWAALSEEAAQLVHTTAIALKINVEVVADTTAGWRLIYQNLMSELEGPRAPLLAVLQSTSSTEQLLQQHALPPTLPYMRVLGASEDEKLFTDPFRWTRLLARRLMQRYYASLLWVAERLALSRLAGIPVCNIAQDSSVHALDVLYTRALHRRRHVLWSSADPAIAYDIVEERPRQVVMPGGYASWSVEFGISRLDVVAILFSQTIQEGDDPSTHALCDRGVTTHFNILRDLVAEVLGEAVQNNVADTLLASVARWLRDPVSQCYEPRLVEMLSGLAHRALTAILIRLAKLGGRTVRVAGNSVIVLTPKYSLQEAIGFATFVTTSLQDQPMLMLLALKPTRFWSPFMTLDKLDYGGLFVAADDALRFRQGEEPTAAEMGVAQNFTIALRLPEPYQRMLLDRVQKVFFDVSRVLAKVNKEIREDASVTLATRTERTTQRVMQGIEQLLEQKTQVEVIDEVQCIADARDLPLVYDHDGPTEDGKTQPSWSSGALALEYTKCLSRLLDLIPSNGAAGKIRNNCIRLCGISPFAPQAQLTVNPLSAYRIQSITCSFCNEDIAVDLGCKRSQAAGGAFSCTECHAPVAAAAIEARLVRRVNQLVVNMAQQDYVCSKCRQVATTYLAQNCCGDFVGKERSIHPELKAMLYFADVQDFLWLRECVEAALACS